MRKTNKTNKVIVTQANDTQMTKSGQKISGIGYNDGTCYFTGYTACTKCGGCNTI